MQNKKNLKKYQEHTLSENSTIVLSNKLLDQINHLHKVVGKVEWSGVLVYKTVKGSIEDYKNFVVEAVEIIPMDVGTSGYTEYEIESADDYVFKNLFERVMLDDDLKIGHIHTHHDMDCYFSTTDMSELHENAPNHNYYLSLIVNFKDYTKWRAKIAQIRTIKSKGSAVYSYKGTNGAVEEKVSLDEEKETLSMIDLKIVAETALEDEFVNRVKELKTEQGRFTGQIQGNKDWTGYYGQPTLFETLGENLRPAVNINPHATTSRITVDTSQKSISDFAWKLISQSNEPLGTLENTLNILDKSLLTQNGSIDFYIESLIDNFDLLFIDHFKTTPTLTSKKLIVEKVAEILEDLEEKNNYVSTIVETTVDALRIEILLED
jgi:proteasome lid subunit RPN8/RPN11